MFLFVPRRPARGLSEAALAPVSRVAKLAMLSAAVFLFLALSPLSATRGELPMPRFDRLLPLGGAAGSTVEVEVSGPDLEDAKTLVFDHDGLAAKPVEGKERRFQVAIAPEVPAGTYDAWLVGRYGISSPRLFHVFRDLAPIAEVEPNNSDDKAQAIQVNSLVQGTSDQNDQDLFRFAAKSGQRLVVRTLASKLDSLMDPTLSLSTAAGQPLASNGDYFGRDALIDFIVPADGDYVVAVSDLSFRGGHPYELIVTDGPQLENVSPRAIRAGQTTELRFFGRNLGAGAVASPLRVGDLPLDELRRPATPPADVAALRAFRFLEHPTDHTTLPTAATDTLAGFQVRAGLPREQGPAIPVLVTEHDVVLEREPNDSVDQAQPITLPAVVSSRFDAARDGDYYELEVAEAGSYAIDVYCERIGGRADAYVAVLDEQGNRVVELDDYGHRVNAFDGHLRDPSGQASLAAKKKYRLLVQDRYRRGGARYQYVLYVRKPIPDFYVAAIHRQNPGPGGTTVGRGGATYLDVIVHATDGFAGPIVITAENAPPGVVVEPAVIHGNSGQIVIRADANAPDANTPDAVHWLTLVATGLRDGETLRREVRPYVRVSTDANYSSSRPTRRLPIAVRDVAPFVVRGAAAGSVTVQAGQKVELKLVLERRWADAKNAVTVQPLAFPGNFKLGNQEFKPDMSELSATLEVAANTRPGDYALVLQCQSQVPFSKDAAAATKPNTLVSLPSFPVRLTVTPPPKP
jgi:hypothetical protein